MKRDNIELARIVFDAEVTGVAVSGEDLCKAIDADSAFNELRELRAWRDKAFKAHPNLYMDIEALGQGE